MKIRILVITALAISLISCGEDTPVSDMDSQLSLAINEASGNVGRVHYILPDSDQLFRIPQDPQNRLTSDKIDLGRFLFHESAFSTTGNFDHLKNTYSCASCHHARAGFQANMAQGIADGGEGFGIAGEGRRIDNEANPDDVDVQPLRTPSAMNLAYQTNLLWNGQFGATAVNKNTQANWTEGTPIATNELGYEGLETQAIAGITVHRMAYNEEAITQHGYKDMFDVAFKNIDESDRYTVERAGQAIAAYERVMISNKAPFQNWLRGDNSALTEAQKEGAIVFFSNGKCTTCHNGPALANMEFHAIGMGDFNTDEVFKFSSDDPSKTGRASFTKNEEDMYKFKVPQLYNLKDSPFYGHGASFKSLREVLEYKNMAEMENPDMDASYLSAHFTPLDLTDTEIENLADFLENGLYDPDLSRYEPQSLPSGNCQPNNDELSKYDLGCS